MYSNFNTNFIERMMSTEEWLHYVLFIVYTYVIVLDKPIATYTRGFFKQVINLVKLF